MIVGAAVRRVVGPFQVAVDALLHGAAARAQFDLGEPRSDHRAVLVTARASG